MSFNKTLTILIAIFLLALLLRLWQLGSLPRTFQEDEVLSGYVGKYILTNGADLYGNHWPLLYFNKFDDYYIIGPMYLTGLSVSIFGSNEFAVRFPAALIGALVIFPLYSLTFWIFRKRVIAYLAAFFVALLPWHLVMSRAIAEGSIAVTIFLSGIALFIYAVETKRIRYIFIASLLLFLTYFIYHPFRLYVPLVFFPFYYVFPAIKGKRLIFSIVVIHLFFLILTGYIALTPWGSGRFKQTSIFSDLSGVQLRIQQSIYNTGEGHIGTTRIFHNKVVGYSREFLKQYLTYFSPVFLFSQTGSESRYDVPDQGLMYYIYLIGIVTSVIFIFREKNIPSQKIFLIAFLIFLSPFPAAFTYYGSPNIHRSLLLGILLVIPAAYGIYKLCDNPYRKYSIVIISIILLAEFSYFWHQYKTQSDIFMSMRRNDGFRELALYLQKEHGRYSQVFVPAEGNTALYYLFFSSDYSSIYATQFGHDAQIPHVGNITFVSNTCASEVISHADLNRMILVVNRHSCAEPQGLEKVAEIKGVNPLLGFRLYRGR